MLLVLFLDRYHHLFYSLIPISYCDVESVTLSSEIDATKGADVGKVSWKTTFLILALTSLSVAMIIGYISWGGRGSVSGAMDNFNSYMSGAKDTDYDKF